MDTRRVFAFLDKCLKAGQSAILVTVVAVDGSSMRDPGTHMGVCEDGSFAGSLSGGCIENAVIAEALEALQQGAPRIVRFGAESPYIDVRLPCGGGLDVHFQPISETRLIEQVRRAIDARRPFSLALPSGSQDPEFLDEWHPVIFDPHGKTIVGHWPEPKLLILGHGAVVPSLARLALHMDMTVEILSPDRKLLHDTARECSVPCHLLVSPSDISAIRTDRWSAIIFLFHDHDWEIALMAHAMTQPHFYLGAMGGRKAHAFRREALRRSGCPDTAIDAVYAPIGLFHSARDPDTLALSALSEMTKIYHQCDFERHGR